MTNSKVIQRIKQRLHAEENSFQALVLGATGTGKSFAGMRICEAIDPTFNIDRVVFTAEDFVELLNSDLPVGCCVLCDEVGLFMGNREWNTLQNKLMSMVLQTYRFRRLCVVWTLPTLRMVDINLRDLTHAIVETLSVDRENNLCKVKFKYREVNPMSGKAYDKFPRIRNLKGDKITLSTINVCRPSPKIEKAYLKKKASHMEGIYKQIEIDLKARKAVLKKPKGRRVTCNKCKYTWHYTGNYEKPTCPSCHSNLTRNNV